jgi:hypothetical protein
MRSSSIIPETKTAAAQGALDHRLTIQTTEIVQMETETTTNLINMNRRERLGLTQQIEELQLRLRTTHDHFKRKTIDARSKR